MLGRRGKKVLEFLEDSDAVDDVRGHEAFSASTYFGRVRTTSRRKLVHGGSLGDDGCVCSSRLLQNVLLTVSGCSHVGDVGAPAVTRIAPEGSGMTGRRRYHDSSSLRVQRMILA